ncbi:MAG: hypothetical protein M3451_06945, partial [Chloroflexota bacterium]|nr:hypothetical protein [Chloroflexota bacterium]
SSHKCELLPLLCAARNMLQRYSEILSAQQYAISFNPSLASADRGVWVSAGHFGLDQGIVVMMIENHRSQLILWLMRDCPYVRTGLRPAGFRGVWMKWLPSSTDHNKGVLPR